VAGELIKTARARQTIKDKLNAQKEVAATIFAMVADETGQKAIGQATIRTTLKKSFPNPAYPMQATQAA
jgi:hypothetical protein